MPPILRAQQQSFRQIFLAINLHFQMSNDAFQREWDHAVLIILYKLPFTTNQDHLFLSVIISIPHLKKLYNIDRILINVETQK